MSEEGTYQEHSSKFQDKMMEAAKLTVVEFFEGVTDIPGELMFFN